MKISRSAGVFSEFVVASLMEPSEMKSWALTSKEAVLSSPSPTPKMTAFPPKRFTFRRYSIEDCECA